MTESKKESPAVDEDCAALLRGELADGLQEVVGLRREFAEEWAERLTGFLRRRLGAQRIYIPGPNRAERDAAIYADFNGSNVAEVCARYSVSRRRFYEILEDQRRLARERGSAVSCLKTAQASG